MQVPAPVAIVPLTKTLYSNEGESFDLINVPYNLTFTDIESIEIEYKVGSGQVKDITLTPGGSNSASTSVNNYTNNSVLSNFSVSLSMYTNGKYGLSANYTGDVIHITYKAITINGYRHILN